MESALRHCMKHRRNEPYLVRNLIVHIRKIPQLLISNISFKLISIALNTMQLLLLFPASPLFTHHGFSSHYRGQ